MMLEYPHSQAQAGHGIGKTIVQGLMKSVGSPRIAIRLWDGQEFPVTDEQPVAMLEFRKREAIIRLLTSPSVGFGECYSEGLLEVHGNFLEFTNEITRALTQKQNGRYHWPRMQARLHALKENSLPRAQRNARHHYDLDNDFYRLWLDKRMVYTCAYYETAAATLAEAQVAKLDHVCRKLDLKPGMTVVEAGCGWGALAMHMAQHYDARVYAYNVSEAQVGWARKQAAEHGLTGKVHFVLDDYRNIMERCDRFVSIGMLEHVGPANYRMLGDLVAHLLKPDGLALVHSIGRSHARPADAWIRKHIFPGGHIPCLAEMSQLFEPQRFTVLDLENLRLHYARTCAAWLQNFEAVSAQVRDRFGETFTRTWRLYLAGSSAGFSSGTLQLYQVLFTHGTNNKVPMTRAYMYPAERSE